MREGRFSPHINYVGPLRVQNFAPADRLLRSQADALAIPGVRRKVDYAHDRRLCIKRECLATNFEFGDSRLQRMAMPLAETGEIFKLQHERIRSQRAASINNFQTRPGGLHLRENS